ncbi:late competence development ComFB family protein [Halanaerocella petrolearia]
MIEKLGKIKEERLHNHTEDVVLEKITELLTEDDFGQVCTCEQCLLDIASHALNQLPAKYTTSSRGEVMTRLDEFEDQPQVDFELKVIQAIKVVAKNPNH